MTLENIRLSKSARDQLITLKRRTGIQNWNVLCRWGFCRSLAEPSQPSKVDLVLDSNVEMSWKTFSGDTGDIYWDLLMIRCHKDGLPLVESTLADQFRLHLHRGIGYLVGDKTVSNISGLSGLATTLKK